MKIVGVVYLINNVTTERLFITSHSYCGTGLVKLFKPCSEVASDMTIRPCNLQVMIDTLIIKNTRLYVIRR